MFSCHPFSKRRRSKIISQSLSKESTRKSRNSDKTPNCVALNKAKFHSILPKVIAVTTLVTLLNLIREKFALVSLIRRPDCYYHLKRFSVNEECITARQNAPHRTSPRYNRSYYAQSNFTSASVVSRH